MRTFTLEEINLIQKRLDDRIAVLSKNSARHFYQDIRDVIVFLKLRAEVLKLQDSDHESP